MLRKTLKIAGAAGALIVSAPLLAQAHGGGMGHLGGMPGGGMSGGGMVGGGMMGGMGPMGAMHSQGSVYASPVGIAHASPNSVLYGGGTVRVDSRGRPLGTNYSVNSQASVHSQALMHASPTGIAHANRNSVLARGGMAANSPQLIGLATGLPVTTSSGRTLGSVTQVITGAHGMVRGVVVTSSTGQRYTISPSMVTGVTAGTVSTAYAG